MDTGNIILTAVTAVLASAAFIPGIKSRRKLRFSRPAYFLLLLLAAATALFIRIYRFGSIPGGVNQDGAMAAVDAMALAEHGTDRLGMKFPVHLTAWGFGQMSALMSYLMIPFVRVSGLNPVSIRLPNLLCSLAGLVFLYLFIKDCFNRGAALTAAFFAAICPWHIMQSRWALDCNLFPHFLMAGMFFLNRGSRGRKPALYISMLFFALSMYCYGVSIYTVPVILIASCIYLLAAKKITAKEALISAAIYLAVAWPFIACMVINAFGLKTIETPLFTIPYFNGSVRSSDILFFSDRPLRQLAENMRAVIETLMQTRRDQLFNLIPKYGTLYIFSLPFLISGMMTMFRNLKGRPGAVLLLIFFAVSVFDGLITASVNTNRINMIFYPLIAFTALGLYRTMRSVRFSAALIAAMYLSVFAMFSNFYFTGFASEISDIFMEDFGKAVASLKGTEAEKIYITADSQYDGAYHVSEILTLYYLDIDAEEYQSSGFRSRYAFKSMKYVDVDPNEDAVYVARADDTGLFGDDELSFTPYGRFCVIKPVKHA